MKNSARPPSSFISFSYLRSSACICGYSLSSPVGKPLRCQQAVHYVILVVIVHPQAELQTAPDRGAAAEQLAGLLASAGQTDWALRVASQAAVEPTTTDRWRALLGVSGVHAERLEVKDAYEWAQKALTSCESSGETRTEKPRPAMIPDSAIASLSQSAKI